MRDCGATVLVVSAELDALAAALPPLLPACLSCFSAGNAAAGFESWDAAVDDARNETPGTRVRLLAARAAAQSPSLIGCTQSADKGRERRSPSPPSEPAVQFSRDGLSIQLFPHRDWRTERWAAMGTPFVASPTRRRRRGQGRSWTCQPQG